MLQSMVLQRVGYDWATEQQQLLLSCLAPSQASCLNLNITSLERSSENSIFNFISSPLPPHITTITYQESIPFLYSTDYKLYFLSLFQFGSVSPAYPTLPKTVCLVDHFMYHTQNWVLFADLSWLGWVAQRDAQGNPHVSILYWENPSQDSKTERKRSEIKMKEK